MKPRIPVVLFMLFCSAAFAQTKTLADYLPGTYVEYRKTILIPSYQGSSTVHSSPGVTITACSPFIPGFNRTIRTLLLTKNRYARLSVDHPFVSFNNSGDNESDYVEYGKWKVNADTVVITFSKVEGAILPESRVIVTPGKNGQLPMLQVLPLVPVRKYVFHMGQLKELAKGQYAVPPGDDALMMAPVSIARASFKLYIF